MPRKLTYNELIHKCVYSWSRMITREEYDDDLNERILSIENPKYIDVVSDSKMEKFRGKYYILKEGIMGGIGWSLIIDDDEYYIRYDEVLRDKWEKHWKYQELLDYLGIVPFTDSVMINVSPDWKSSKEKMSNTTKAKRLETLIDTYLKIDQRYDYVSYVIENGATGEHIHAHVVAHINPKIVKSVNTHLAHGNHTQALVRCAKGIKGMEGTIKGQGVMKTFLRVPEMVRDKLDYLEEEKKPEGHKNKSVLTGRVDKVYFTVK